MVGRLSVRKRMKNSIFLSVILMIALTVRIGYIQLIQGDELKEKAYAQQTSDRAISSKRGTIYDTTGERVLAQSISTNIVTAVPNSVSKDNKEDIATNIAQILGKDKDEILKKLQQNVSSVTLATKVDQ